MRRTHRQPEQSSCPPHSSSAPSSRDAVGCSRFRPAERAASSHWLPKFEQGRPDAEILVEPAIWHVQHRKAYVFRFCITRLQIDIDAPRFLENLGINREGLADDQRLVHLRRPRRHAENKK